MTQIALGVGGDRDRDLLATLLDDHDVVDVEERVPEGTDLCIVDESGLSRDGEAFTEWCDDQHPVFAPVLLLVDADTENPWVRYSENLAGGIDAIERVPIPKSALALRVNNLLRTRGYSRELSIEHQLTERVFETSPLAKLVVDTDGTVVRANRRAEDVFGVPRSELVGLDYDAPDWEAVDDSGDRIPTGEQPVHQVLDAGDTVFGYEHGIDRPDGDRVWVSANVAPLLSETGEVEYVVAVFEDVTERRTRERDLERHVDLFEKAQDIGNVGAWEYDVRADEGWWTDEVGRFHGLPAGTDPSPEMSLEFYHPADRPIIEDAFGRAVEEGDPYDLELRLGDADGQQRWVRTRGEPQYEDGEVVRVRGTMQDITDRKERELELRRMSRAVDEAPIGVVVTDPSQEDNPMVYVNDGFVDLTGYPKAESTGRNCRFLQGENTDAGTVREMRRAIDAEEPVSVVVRNYRRDGTEFWNAVEIAPVRDSDGEVINYIGFQQDVTDRVERERQLDVLDRYLRHNLRNELGVVQGMAELILGESGPPISERAGEIIDHSSSLVDTMEKEREITQLLRSDPDVGPTELTTMLRSVVDGVRAEYPAAELSLSGPESVTVRATPELELAVEELVGNAIEHNDNETPTVEVTVDVGPERVALAVRDDGVGIPAMEVDSLLEPEGKTALDHGGGLGLWLVYLVVRRCGGTIEFAENEPEGTVVTVELPRREAPS